MKSKIYVSHQNSVELCMEELYKSMKNDFKHSCNFYFFAIHPSFPIDEITPSIDKFFNTDNYVAFHAINAFKNNEIHQNSIVMCCIKFQNSGNVKVFYVEDIENNVNENVLNVCSKYLNNNSHSFHILLAGLANGRFGTFLDNLSKMVENDVVSNFVGGISSGFDVNGETLTYQFTGGKVIKNGLVIVTFENVKGTIEVSLGFQPYGVTYEAEETDGYDLYSVANSRKFIEVINRILRGIENPEVKLLWYAPLYMIDDQSGSVVTLRTIKEIRDDHVVLFGPIKNGDKFKLSFAIPEDLIEEDKEAAIRLKKRVSTPDLAFNFSCIARQYIMEDKDIEEPIVYSDILGTNLFGFFTFGEIGPDKKFKKIKLYNETSLLVAMREL